MPKGSPNAQTVASEKYQKKAGYMTKGFKLKRDVAERFAEACEKAGVSQAAQITAMMNKFIEDEFDAATRRRGHRTHKKESLFKLVAEKKIDT